MSNIGIAIQQSAGILGQMLAPRNQTPPNTMQQMNTTMNFQAPPQHPFQKASSSSGTYSQREKRSNVTNKTYFGEMKKPIISCKNEKVREIIVIIILSMFDETFFAE